MEQIALNGKIFTEENADEIKHLDAEDLSLDTLAAISDFLKEWWNNEPFIKVNTSGSTGSPKMIRLAKKTVYASADKTIGYFGLNSETTGLLCLSCRYIAGKLMLVRAIRSGMNLIVAEPATDVVQHITQKIHFAAMIPSQVKSAIADTESRLLFSGIDQVLIGGGPVSSDLEKDLQGLSNGIFHSYGMTETATHVALRKFSNKPGHYAALPGVSFSLDERNCLVIEANHFQGKVITNDIVELSDEFRFQWLGRADNAIISGGLKFIPEVLETKISPYISNPFYITGLPDAKLGERIILVIESETWPDARIENLYVELRRILEGYEVPKEVRFLKEFPRTLTGKIKRTGTL